MPVPSQVRSSPDAHGAAADPGNAGATGRSGPSEAPFGPAGSGEPRPSPSAGTAGVIGEGKPAQLPLLRSALALPAALLAFVAGLTFDGSFRLSDIVLECVLAAFAPAAVVAAAHALSLRRRHKPAPLVLTVGLPAAFWALLLPWIALRLAAPNTGSPSSQWTVLTTAVTDGPKQLLSSTPPALANATLLFVVATLVWWAATWAAEMAVRAASPPLAALLPALVFFGGTAASVRGGGGEDVPAATAFVAVFVLFLAGDRALRRLFPGSTGGSLTVGAALRGLTTVAVTALAAGIALVAVPVLPGLNQRPPWDPRSLIAPPTVAQNLLDPLGQVAEWLDSPPTTLFTVDTSTPVNLRWVVLDQYDGASWTSSADYQAAGAELPSPPGGAGSVRDVTVTVHPDALPGSWLPTPDRPTSVRGLPVRVDAGMEALATGAGQAADQSYTVDAAVPQLSATEVETAVPARDAASDIVLPGGLPTSVATFGDQLTAHAVYPYQQMVQLEDQLRRLLRYDVIAAPGDSYGNLAFFVNVTHSGGADQFATLFAVLARHAGFPTRIVVGFGPGTPIGQNRYQVTTADAQVWPEVDFQGLGWIPFFPLPGAQPSGEDQIVHSAASPPPARSALDNSVASATPAPLPAEPTPHVQIAAPSNSGSDSGIVTPAAGVIAAVLIAGYLAAAGAARGRARRLRRRDPDPRRRLVGAWRDARASLRLAGAGPTATLTPGEVAARARTVLGDDAAAPAGTLAHLVGAALFSADPPRPEDVTSAWAAADTLRTRARRRMSWWRRARGWLRVRPPQA